ncbi:hypothetical protein Tco_0599940 [Tanacetum coccineum]
MLEPVKDLSTEEMERYYADIKVMNYILQGIPNDIYNFVDACEDAQAKRNARNHDPLALVANSYANPSYSHASPSYSQSPQPYYVTHSLYVHDYDDDYQGEIQGEAQEDKLSKRVVWEKALGSRNGLKKEEILFGCMFHRKYGVTVSQIPLGPSYHLQVLPKL